MNALRRRDLVALGLLATAGDGPGAQARAAPVVVATTPDLKSIVDAVAAGSVVCTALVPPGTDAEAFEPRPLQLLLLREAALVVRVGLGYDDWLERLPAQPGQSALRRGGERHIDGSALVALLEVQGRSVEQRSGHAHGAANPHYWLDPSNAEPLAAAVADALVRIVPERAAAIAAAHALFVTALRAAIVQWTTRLEPLRGTPMVAWHNAWPYFARRFRLNIVDVVERKDGVPPGTTRLALLAATMRQRGVRAILLEPHTPGDGAAFLAVHSGAKVVRLAPSVGMVLQAGDLLALIQHNVEQLEAARLDAR